MTTRGASGSAPRSAARTSSPRTTCAAPADRPALPADPPGGGEVDVLVVRGAAQTPVEPPGGLVRGLHLQVRRGDPARFGLHRGGTHEGGGQPEPPRAG